MQIRTLRDDELSQCVKLQKEVWQFSMRDLVTEEMLRLSERSGGILLGAFATDGRMAGFVFSIPVSIPGHRLIQHSHMLAVCRELRDSGIGNQLKWAQYDAARQAGCSRVTWTFDPLESRNGHLNLNKLGAFVKHYYVNLYGESPSSVLHQGIGTDRFLAEWSIPTPAERPSMKGEIDALLAIPQAITTALRGDYRIPTGVHLDHSHSQTVIAVEVPRRIQGVKEKDAEAGMAWRNATREVFQHYLPRHSATGLFSSTGTEARSFYRLELESGFGATS